jgi:histone H3/H4
MQMNIDGSTPQQAKQTVFPLNRIRSAMKVKNPELHISKEAVMLLAKATELIAVDLSHRSQAFTDIDRRKTLTVSDIQNGAGMSD